MVGLGCNLRESQEIKMCQRDTQDHRGEVACLQAEEHRKAERSCLELQPELVSERDRAGSCKRYSLSRV